MTTQDRADPPSLAIAEYLDAASFERAGDAALQRRLQELAWAMVEPLPDRAKGTELPVLASTWLRAHGWSVLLLPRDEEER
ncbi:hypothetical protein [Siccirubricoccus phaeus]|uniref:hypothetical protein n=1 Tax=Siccirubricoccus phaeus TaxID=2595053 RepID=UPI0011F3D529|nr:hypothetical protein [Siccirubricoccus phaeus]